LKIIGSKIEAKSVDKERQLKAIETLETFNRIKNNTSEAPLQNQLQPAEKISFLKPLYFLF
jgi:hypothetical protein